MRANARFCCNACRVARHRYVTTGGPLWVSKNALFGGQDRHFIWKNVRA
jgi:hypothetical protein